MPGLVTRSSWRRVRGTVGVKSGTSTPGLHVALTVLAVGDAPIEGGSDYFMMPP